MRLDDKNCKILLHRIKTAACTPFLGAAVNDGILPLGSDIANEWAAKYDYPLDSKSDLARIAQ
jgi:hypothetical protein